MPRPLGRAAQQCELYGDRNPLGHDVAFSDHEHRKLGDTNTNAQRPCNRQHHAVNVGKPARHCHRDYFIIAYGNACGWHWYGDKHWRIHAITDAVTFAVTGAVVNGYAVPDSVCIADVVAVGHSVRLWHTLTDALSRFDADALTDHDADRFSDRERHFHRRCDNVADGDSEP